MQTVPTLLNSCASATTAAEARFRIDAPIPPSRAGRVIALDEEAAAVVGRVADLPWANARFFTCRDRLRAADGNGASVDGLPLRGMDGSVTPLGEQLAGADVVVMVATTDDGAASASVIGAACTLRGIMTAGLVLSDGISVGAALSALRPHARVLLVPAEEEDLSELLTALRA